MGASSGAWVVPEAAKPQKPLSCLPFGLNPRQLVGSSAPPVPLPVETAEAGRCYPTIAGSHPGEKAIWRRELQALPMWLGFLPWGWGGGTHGVQLPGLPPWPAIAKPYAGGS